MTFRTTEPPRLENFGNNVQLWASALSDYLISQGRDLETESVARDRATAERFTVTGSANEHTLNVSTSTLAQTQAFIAEIVRHLKFRRIIRASIS